MAIKRKPEPQTEKEAPPIPTPWIKFYRMTSNIKMPTRAHGNDAGIDVYSPKGFAVFPQDYTKIGLELKVEFSPGHVLLVQGRSGLAMNRGIFPIGGVIDEGYRGEIHLCLCCQGLERLVVRAGDKVAQLILLPVAYPSISEVLDPSEFSISDRGEAGLGSTKNA